MDSQWTTTGSVPLSVSRVSTRSTRKKKSSVMSPKKLVENLQCKSSSKKIEDGVFEIYKELRKETSTFFNFFKAANRDKNAKPQVWLYDWSRVVISEAPDYYHASYVDGFSRQNQYILAQAPFNSVTQKDFFRMIAQTKIEGLVLLDPSEEVVKMTLPKGESKFGGLSVKISDEKTSDDLTTALLAVGSLKGLKTFVISQWTSDTELPADLVESHDKVRKALGPDLKNPVMIVCKDGSTRSGIYAMLDTESERLKQKQRVKVGDTIKNIRGCRYHTFESFENFELAINVAVELCKRANKPSCEK